MIVFSGADLAALVREASVQALKEFIRKEVYPDNSRPIQLKREHFEEAFNKLRPSVSLEVSYFRGFNCLG